ncbi:MAG: hypothetical protein EOP84_02415 [Verrucomicrobiaceae bacterium]|nr:MAG: hypothetical protein EOP84_02415 [Verrucomicrobiaceae bacterium]
MNTSEAEKAMEKAIWPEWNFAALLERSDIEQQAAVFYEYARENEAIRTAVEQLRASGVLIDPDPYSRAQREMPEGLRQSVGHIRLALLAFMPFPRSPFLEVIDSEEAQALAQGSPSRHLAPLTLEQFRRIHGDADYTLNGAELEQLAGRSRRVLTIPWGYTDKDLLRMFAALLKEIRPSAFPEPKTGRNGSFLRVPARDRLRQLAALRLHSQGFTCSRTPTGWEDFRYTQKGWKTALRDARKEIEAVATRVAIWLPSSDGK